MEKRGDKIFYEGKEKATLNNFDINGDPILELGGETSVLLSILTPLVQNRKDSIRVNDVLEDIFNTKTDSDWTKEDVEKLYLGKNKLSLHEVHNAKLRCMYCT